ncbi:MAG: GNAT family N-acetyltransferase [Alteromonadaceae bacterium]|nr:GNAT family N-acetyltransferase [Alteromonadaceae bacterium]|tara:strand:- start:1987 stop:2442 length:456 start_codon:yes stop_codon:yes gene_type:complete
MANLMVQQASLADVKCVAELFDEYRQFYGQASNVPAARDFLLARASQGESVIFVAKAAERAMGFVQLFPAFSSVSLARTFILNDLYTRPEGRRGGVATRLLQAAENYAKAVGAIRLTLSTALTNEPAQALYRASGWDQDDQFCVFHRAIST